MLSKELKKLIKMSGGKIILSDGKIEKSYVVMDLKHYLHEREMMEYECFDEGDEMFHECDCDFCEDPECEVCDDDFSEFDDFDKIESEINKIDKRDDDDDMIYFNDDGCAKGDLKLTNGKLTKDELLDKINADIETLRAMEAEDNIVNGLDLGKEKEDDIRYEKVDQ